MANISADGKLRYDTDIDQLFVIYNEDEEEVVKTITDFIKGFSEAEIRQIENPDEYKFYVAADSKYIMYYANNQWNTIATSGSFEQIQSDWNQVNPTMKDYIKHKPEIPVVDSTYSGTSPNAQSGIGIHAAFGNVVRTTDKATNVRLGIVKPDGITIVIDSDGTIRSNYEYTLPKASTTVLGGVKVDGRTILTDQTGSGTISVPTATASKVGVVSPDGTSITVDAQGNIALAAASTTVLGGVKVDGTSIVANSGTITGTSLVTRTATNRVPGATVEAALTRIQQYRTKTIQSTDWVANTDTATNTDYPFIYTFTDTNYDANSHPSWQMNGVGNIPTAAERDEIEKVKEIFFTDSTHTLYAEEKPSVTLVLEIIGF